jgi:Fic family protein
MGARLFESLPRHPVITVKSAVRLGETTKPTAAKAIDSLCTADILVETSGRSRDRTYAYREYLDLLKEGAEDY